MEPDGDLPPIWSTPSTLFVPVRHRRHRGLYWFLNPVALTIAFSVLVIIIVFLLLAPTLSRSNQVLKPNSSVKKSWNSINVFLVLFAVLCGVFARRNDETSSSDGAETVPNAYEFVTSGRRSVSDADWLDSPDRKAYDKMSNYMNIGDNRLMRSSSSYPDLRQESLWGSDGEKFKYFDDFEVDFHFHVRQSHEVEKDAVAETTVRETPVDKFELNNSIPPLPTPPIVQVPQPPPPPPPPPVKRIRSIHSFPKQYNVERRGREAEFNGKRSSLPPPSKTPAPTLPPPAELKFHSLAERREKIQRKKSGTTKEIATGIVSVLYQGTQRKRNKKVKSRDIFESVAQNSSPPTELAQSSIPSVPPPPPPPPPPSKKVLQNLFKKSSKSKRVHSVSTSNPPPPPPPPPPNSIFNNIFKTGSISKRFQMTSASSQPPPPPPPPPPSSKFNSWFKNGTKSRRVRYIDPQPLPPTPRSRPKHSPASTGKPPIPTKPSTYHQENVVIAPVSPLIPMPPPPPPPPFTVPEMKFIGKGDFIRIRSANSSPCSSPGLEDLDVMSIKSDGGDSIGRSFTCPSPDVDLKADTFISKRRDEWRLEKINSLKEKRNTGSSSARLR